MSPYSNRKSAFRNAVDVKINHPYWKVIFKSSITMGYFVLPEAGDVCGGTSHFTRHLWLIWSK